MNVVIIEDEKPAAEKLKKSLREIDGSLTVVAVLASVRESTDWFEKNPAPGLVFVDIELSDGLSFGIFEKVKINCPVIFTTAYDEYWQEAFEYNSIDYLLKPVKQEKLAAALKKYDQLKKYFTANIQQLMNPARTPAAKTRFLVKKGSDYVTVRTDDIAYFYATHKLVCMVDKNGQRFILDKSLSDLEKEVSAAMFNRVNRKFLVHIDAIRKIKPHTKGKLLLELAPVLKEEVVVSQENAAQFKEWISQAHS